MVKLWRSVPLNANTSATALSDTTGTKLVAGNTENYIVQDPSMPVPPSQTLQDVISRMPNAVRSTSRKCVTWLTTRGATVALLTACSLPGCNDSSSTKDEAYYYPIVVSESATIGSPSGAAVTEQRGHKYGGAWVHRTISTSEKREEVRLFFDEQLRAQSWRPSEALYGRSTADFVELDYYCKGKTEVELAFQRSTPPSDAPTVVKLSIYWISGDDGACDDRDLAELRQYETGLLEPTAREFEPRLYQEQSRALISQTLAVKQQLMSEL